VVYMSGPAYRPGLLAFSAGLLIGSWLNSDLDWHTHRVYYHGWVGSGWIAYSRPYVSANRIYVNDRYRSRVWVNPAYRSRPVVVNRTYVTRHVNRYEFNRNRPVRQAPRETVRRPATALDRINAAREHREVTRTPNVESHGRGIPSTTTPARSQRERTTTTITTPHRERTTTTNTTVTPHRERTTTTTTTAPPHRERTTTTDSGSHGNRTSTTDTKKTERKKRE
jgi:hypothetical protein